MTKLVGYHVEITKRVKVLKSGMYKVLFCMGMAIVFSAEGFFDNRCMPSLLEEKSCIRWCRAGNASIAPFFVFADRAYGPYDDSRPLFGIGGSYDLYHIDEALRLAGLINQSFLRPDIETSTTTLPFLRDGQLEVLGLAFDGRYDVADALQWGFKGSLMHAQSRALFIFDDEHSSFHLKGEGDQFEILQARDAVHTFMGIKSPVWNEYMAGDIELFARLHGGCSYLYRIHRFDAGITCGMVLPCALAYDVNQPLSMALGGDKSWGGYGKLDIRALLKEDMQIGLWGRIQKRVSRTVNRRMVVSREHMDYGAVVGPVQISPGVTGGFGFEVILEHARGGLGFYLAYGAVFHGNDVISDKRENKTVKVMLNELCDVSEWSADYVTIGCMYDAAGDCASMDTCKPVFLFSWDIPLGFIAGKNALKSNGIMVRGEIQF